MEKKNIDDMLEQLKQDRNIDQENFCSTEQFKEKFHQKVNQNKQNGSHFLKWGIPLAAAACLVLGTMITMEEPLPETTVSSQYPRSGEMITMEEPLPETTGSRTLNENVDTVSAAPAAPILNENVDTVSAAPAAPIARVKLRKNYSPSKKKSAPKGIVAYSISSSMSMNMRAEPGMIPRAPEWNTEEYKTFEENPFLKVTGNPLSTFGADVDTASYTNVRRFLNAQHFPPKDAVRIEEFVNFFRYDYPAPKSGEKFSVTYESAPAPWNKDHQLLLIGVQGMDIPTEKLPPANYVFLVDNSGSMYQEMDLVIEALSTLVDQMREQDKISLVTYGGGVQILLDGIRGDQKSKANKLIKQLTSSGYTPGSDGIRTAYELAHKHFVKQGNNRIILITDGDFNVGVSSESELVRMVEKERDSMIYLSTFGVGSGNYQENKLKMLSNKGNGNYFYIDNMKEARKAMKSCFAGRMFALAKDVKFQVEFNPAKVSGYRLLGYEMRKLADRDFNDDSKDSGEIGVGHQVTVLYELIPAGGKSTAAGTVDPLKYQRNTAVKSDEILTCKLRYQDPAEKKESELRVFPLNSMPAATANLQWASAVAEFAMILRDSPHKGNASYSAVLKRAKKYLGEDPDGKRAEFLTLVHNARDAKRN